MEDTPQFSQMILHRRAGQRDLPFGLERANLCGRFAVTVLDILSFVQNQRAPFDLPEQFSLAKSKPVTADHEISFADFVLQIDAIDISKQDRRQ